MNVNILDCTLRDGSYAIDFQFSEVDTSDLTRELSDSGIKYVEVGHGIGLGATRKKMGVARATDLEYCQAANNSISPNSKWGMFCIPGIASIEDLQMAIENGIGFVRVGTDIDKVHESEPFITLAKKNGIEVFSNFMKSYILNPKEFSLLAKKSFDYGVDGVYLVDSAGGMLTSEVRDYIRETFYVNPDKQVGFHGHNNLGLAMANASVCIEEGVKFIDSSLQGMGRSSGNVATEHLVCLLHRLNYNIDLDPIMIMDIGERLVRPLIQNKGISSLDITAGLSLFHSSYMNKVLSIAKQNCVDPRLLIYELCKINKMSAPESLLLDIANQIKIKSNNYSSIKNWPNYFGIEDL